MAGALRLFKEDGMGLKKHKLAIELGAVQRDTLERAVSGTLAELGQQIEGYKATISVELVAEDADVDTLKDRIRKRLSKNRGVGVKVKHTNVDEYMTDGKAWENSPMAKALAGMAAPLGDSVESVTLSVGDQTVTLQ